MANNDVAGELRKINSSLTDIQSEISALKSEVATGFRQVDTRLNAGLNASKVRDEEILAKVKLGYEAVQGLRESTDARFDGMSKENREQTDLLKSVIVHVRRRVV